MRTQQKPIENGSCNFKTTIKIKIMATMTNGINGKFSGKIGNIVLSNWKGINYVRSIPTKKRESSSPAQMMQQARFSLLVKFLRNYKDLLSFSFNNKPKRMSGSNEALSYNLGNGIIGDYPNLELNYPAIQLCHGRNPLGLGSVIAKAGETGAIDFSWGSESPELSYNGSNAIILMTYNPLTGLGDYAIQSVVGKSRTASIFIAENRNCAIETWIASMSLNTTKVSDSHYTGRVTTL